MTPDDCDYKRDGLCAYEGSCEYKLHIKGNVMLEGEKIYGACKGD